MADVDGGTETQFAPSAPLEAVAEQLDREIGDNDGSKILEGPRTDQEGDVGITIDLLRHITSKKIAAQVQPYCRSST